MSTARATPTTESTTQPAYQGKQSRRWLSGEVSSKLHWPTTAPLLPLTVQLAGNFRLLLLREPYTIITI